MLRYTLAVVTLLTCSGAFADELIDDFERGSAKNLRNGDWYYFSDVKDSGNSQIVNAAVTDNGSYASFLPDTGGCNRGKCARLEFSLGNNDNLLFPPFVGIGTDLKPRSEIVDINPATAIAFKARSSDTLVIFVEIVTGNIYDYAYYRAYFMVSPSWQEFRVAFFDTATFMFPGYGNHKKRYSSQEKLDHPLNLAKVQKINWQVSAFNYNLFHPSPLINYLDCNIRGNLTLFLDDITILGITPTPIKAGRYGAANQKMEPLAIITASDLLGRRLPVADLFKRTTGMFILPGASKGRSIIFNGKTRFPQSTGITGASQ